MYVKKQDTNVWHWCTNCSTYPKGNELDTRKGKPRAKDAKFCAQCTAKTANLGCKK